MARVSTPLASMSDSTAAEASELAQILSRLQDSILHPTPERERQLRRSYIEREKLASVSLTTMLLSVWDLDAKESLD